MARPPEGNANEVIRRRRRVTTAASSDDSVVAHSSLPAASRVSPSSVVCSTTPLAQTFPQLAQHVVERGALTHSHDSERSSLCSQRGSLSELSSLRSARSHDFALIASRTRAPLMGGRLRGRFDADMVAARDERRQGEATSAMQIGGKDAFERLKTRRTVVHLVCPRQMALGAPREVRSAS